MSAPEVTLASGAAPTYHRRVSTRFFRSEMRLIFGRRRNQAGLLVLMSLPVLINVASYVRGGSGGGGFFDSITQNGLFAGLVALTLEVPLFLPLAVATISGDSVAGEANQGTLRYLLVVPVRRARLLAVKYAAIVVFGLFCSLLVVATGALLGLALFGGGAMPTLSGGELSFGQGLGRTLLAALYVGAGLASLGAFGLFVSTLTEQPIGATIAIVVFSSAQFIADSIPQVSFLQPWLLVHHWLDFTGLFRGPVDTSGMQTGLWVDLAYAVVFLLAAWARFSDKDVTS